MTQAEFFLMAEIMTAVDTTLKVFISDSDNEQQVVRIGNKQAFNEKLNAIIKKYHITEQTTPQ